MFLFTEDCLIGVEEIDAEHKHLFDLLNRAVYMLNDEYASDKYTEIKDLLQELQDYAEEHFAHEEAYMKKIRDPELILQRPQHLFFEEKVIELMVKNIDEDDEQQEALEEIINFLARWLYHHIIGSDTMIGKLPPLEEWMLRENPCEFTEEYLTGVDMIDNEHKHLFEIAERVNEMVKHWSEGDAFDGVTHILNELKDYTEVHFASEEAYMRSINYSGYDAQKRAHDAFISRLQEIDLNLVEEDPRKYMESLMEFLLGWLINHILHVDKQIPCRE